ncbi:MAG: enoyl-CoA hydratase-related protein [Micrococcales bacterium]|nr:enoyl-CoA hydratase-related protein [Micrococcales bacterium]
MSELVLREDHGPVAVLTFNRPDRMNAWTGELEVQYFDHLEACERDDAIRAIVVTGAGRAWCAGADMQMLDEFSDGEGRPDKPADRPGTLPLRITTPLIAALNGAAAGVGFVQALYCDIRFATPTAKLVTSFAQRGLVGEYGVTWLLPRIVGRSRAMDLLLSSRIVTGEEALAMGLVDRVVAAEDLLDTAIAYAQEMASRTAPQSHSMIKQQMLLDADATRDESVDRAVAMMLASFATPSFAEGVASFIERRDPRFPPIDPSTTVDDFVAGATTTATDN